MKTKSVVGIAGLALMFGLVGCGGVVGEPVVTETASASEAVSASATATATDTASPTPVETVTVTAEPSAAPVETVTAEPEAKSGSEPDGSVLDRARWYMEVGDMSKVGLINALVAEGWSYATAEEAEATIRDEYNYDHEAIDAVEGYLEWTPNASREEVIMYLHHGLGFTESGSVRIVDTEFGL